MNVEEAHQTLSEVRTSLANGINQLNQMFIQVHDFEGSEAAREGLIGSSNQYINILGAGDQAARKLDGKDGNDGNDFPIPQEVIQYIEDGRNPDIYIREFVENTRKANQYLRGRSVALDVLKRRLGKKIVEEFPEMRGTVEGIMERTDCFTEAEKKLAEKYYGEENEGKEGKEGKEGEEEDEEVVL